MSQGSFFDAVQDQLFDAPAVSRAPSAPVGPSLAEQSAAAQEVHDLWADRLGARTTRACRCTGCRYCDPCCCNG